MKRLELSRKRAEGGHVQLRARGAVAIAVAMTVAPIASVVSAAQAHAAHATPTLIIRGTLLTSSVDVKITGPGAAASATRDERRYAIKTANGASVPLEPGSVGGDLADAATGTPVTAVLAIDADDQDTLDDAGVDLDRLVADGTVAARAADVLAEAGDPVRVLSSGLASGPAAPLDGGTTSALTTSSAHRAYVVVINDTTVSGSFSTTGARFTTLSAAGYWLGEGRGKISAFDVTRVITWNHDGSCGDGSWSLWDDAGAKFPGVAFGPGSRNHLVVFLPMGCRSKIDYTGEGTVGSGLESGGRVVVVDPSMAVLSHEFGHNLGLGHSNLEVESSGKRSVQEYYGFFGPQSAAIGAYQPGSLDLAYQDFLGVAGASAIKDVQNLAASTTPLSPVYAPDGVRGVSFADPRTSERYFVEFRPGNGADAGTYYSTFTSPGWPYYFSLAGRDLDFAPGLRVYRAATHNDLITSTTVRSGRTAATLLAGESFQPASGGFTVSAVSADAATSSVRVALTAVGSATSVTLPKATYGKASRIVVKVTGVAPFTGSATGQADLYVGGAKLGTATLSSGQATYQLPSTLAAGRHTVIVKYLGSSLVKGSSRSGVLTVSKAKAKAKLVTATNLKKGRTATVSVGLTGVGAQPPTGQVVIKVGLRSVTKPASVRRVGSSWRLTIRTAKLPTGWVSIAYRGNRNLAAATYPTSIVVK